MDNSEKKNNSLINTIGIYKVNKIKKEFNDKIILLPTNEGEVEINNKTEKLFKRKIIFCEIAFFRNLMLTFIAVILTIVPFIIDAFLGDELIKNSSLSSDNIMTICYAIGGILAAITLGMALWTGWSFCVKKYVLANKNNITLLNENQIMPDKQEKQILPQANVSFQNKNGFWFYHDGMGNFFTSNSNNEWIPSSAEVALL